jgi:putative toxin-antitoxin system antitoxin component (TIGR02293 family)
MAVKRLLKAVKKAGRAGRGEAAALTGGGQRGRTGTGARAFKLLVSRDTSTAARIEAIRGGVGARVLDEMVEYLDVPKTALFGVLHTPESTAHRLIRDNRILDSAATERVMRVADIMRMAEETFGGRAAATQWLKRINLALGDRTPLSMLDTEPGAGEVRRILASIDHGGVY